MNENLSVGFRLRASGFGLRALRGVVLTALLFSSAVSHTGAQQNDYVVGPQDVLTITVFGEPELSGKYTVEQDGTFTFPQIGRVKGGGLTLRALEGELKKQLADGYLKNPQVAVSIETYRSQRILVLGEVRSPGEYQLTGEMTLLAALARAGSTTPSASHQAVIVRPAHRSHASRGSVDSPGSGDGDAEIIRVDLGELQAGNVGLNVALQDGDTVNVPKAQSVFVTGQVRTPGAYAVDNGTTVLQVLSLAGGLTDRGSDSRIRLQRTIRGKKIELKAKLTDPVEPGDTIIVPERFF
jgi:polysaccharide export outer membrane protein